MDVGKDLGAGRYVWLKLPGEIDVGPGRRLFARPLRTG